MFVGERHGVFASGQPLTNKLHNIVYGISLLNFTYQPQAMIKAFSAGYD